MRKITLFALTLMMTFTMMFAFVGCATTSPVDTSVCIDAGDWFIATYSDSEPVTFLTTFSDDTKVEICKTFAPEEANGKHLSYIGFRFHKVDWVSEKYYTYFLVKKDEPYAVLVVNVNDGRELRLYYYLKDIVE